eukprot:Transcript_32076.p1 GENE.Transcript_32076~~Transcript_32076.p1  ORF type:complete len:715 (+),score=179.38 Transcript_32076:1622-3766(+)
MSPALVVTAGAVGIGIGVAVAVAAVAAGVSVMVLGRERVKEGVKDTVRRMTQATDERPWVAKDMKYPNAGFKAAVASYTFDKLVQQNSWTNHYSHDDMLYDFDDIKSSYDAKSICKQVLDSAKRAVEELHSHFTLQLKSIEDAANHRAEHLGTLDQVISSVGAQFDEVQDELSILMLRALYPPPAYKSFADQEPAPNGVCLRFLLATPLQERPLLMQQLAAASRLHLNQQEWRMPLKSFGTFNQSYNLVPLANANILEAHLMIEEPTLLHELLQEAYTTDMTEDGALAAWALRIAHLIQDLSEQQSPDSKATFIRESIIACYPWAMPPEFKKGMQLDPAMIYCFAVMVAHASVGFNHSLTEQLHGLRVRRGLQDEPAHLIKKIAEKSQALASLLKDCLCTDPAQRLTISQVIRNHPLTQQARRRQKAEEALEADGFALKPLDQTDPMWRALAQLLETSDPGQLGTGRDASEYGEYNELQLASAWHIQHPQIEERFHAAKNKVVNDMKLLDRRGVHSSCAQPSGLPVATARAAAGFALTPAASESVLLHGTSSDVLLSVLTNGLNPNLCGTNAGTAFGEGVYLAEDVAKTDHYSEPDVGYDGSSELHRRLYGDCNRHQGSVFYVLVCRALLGYPARTTHYGRAASHMGTGEPLFPISFRELAVIPDVSPPMFYHSLIAERGPGHLRYREFIFFHGEYVCPEYLLAYHRCHNGRVV